MIHVKPINESFEITATEINPQTGIRKRVTFLLSEVLSAAVYIPDPRYFQLTFYQKPGETSNRRILLVETQTEFDEEVKKAKEEFQAKNKMITKREFVEGLFFAIKFAALGISIMALMILYFYIQLNK